MEYVCPFCKNKQNFTLYRETGFHCDGCGCMMGNVPKDERKSFDNFYSQNNKTAIQALEATGDLYCCAPLRPVYTKQVKKVKVNRTK